MSKVYGLNKKEDIEKIRYTLMHMCRVGTTEYQEGWSDERVSDYLVGDNSITKEVARIRKKRSKLLANPRS
jgi:hypothetical protein